MHRHHTHPHRTARIAITILGVATLLTAWLVAPARATDYGSGTIAAWAGFSHGMLGDWVDTPYDGDPTADVGIIGDSITNIGWTTLQTSLAAKGKTLAVNYWSGRPTTPAVDFALSLTTPPPVLIMAVGTNDIFDPSVMATQVARLRAGLPSSTQVYWVDVQAARSGTATADQRNSGWINLQIRQACLPPTCTVIPWSVWFASAPNRIPMYIPDGIHPDEDGKAFWASVLTGAIYPTAKRK